MITATSQQTRFDPDSINATEIDLRGVNLAIGDREILTDARLLLKSETKYGLIGSNGCGKSSRCSAYTTCSL
jgi:ATP-binding cassette subfamily F protein 3